jgi:hypothetical protein
MVALAAMLEMRGRLNTSEGRRFAASIARYSAMNRAFTITIAIGCALLLALSDNHHPHIAEQPSTYIQASQPIAANTAAPAIVSSGQ